jgi:hypothetical protein
MERRFQFTTKNALLATFWAVVWVACATASHEAWFSIKPRWLSSLLGTFSIIVPPAAAFGAICGRPTFGFLCGVASFAALWLWLEVSPPVH